MGNDKAELDVRNDKAELDVRNDKAELDVRNDNNPRWVCGIDIDIDNGHRQSLFIVGVCTTCKH